MSREIKVEVRASLEFERLWCSSLLDSVGLEERVRQLENPGEDLLT